MKTMKKYEKIEELFIEITNHCLQNCIHCSSNATSSQYEEIPIEKLKQVVLETVELGLKSVVLSGGEPFLYPNLDILVDFLRDSQLSYSLYTCGVTRDVGGTRPLLIDDFERVNSNYLSKIIFSLHAGCPETQAKISCFSDSFAYVLQSIRAAKSLGIDVEIHVVPMSVNFSELRQVLEIANDLGVSRVSFLRFVLQGRGTEKLRLNKDQFFALQEMYNAYKDGYKNVKVRFGTPFNCITYHGGRCTAGLNKLLLNAYGEILPCEAFKYLHGQRPTIYQHDIAEVWQNDPLLDELRDIDLNTVSTCCHCPHKEGCRGGCPGQRRHLNGDFRKGPDPSCILQ